MKRNIAISIHILAVVVLAAALAVLHGYSKGDSGIAWTEESSFEDSLVFSELVSDDIANIKRFAVLKNAFEDETDNEVDTYTTVVFATTSNGTIGYRLSDLITQAARYGYTIDSETHKISFKEVSGADDPYELKVTYKTYDPYYFDRIEFGPTQGVSDIRAISIETLRALAEYYSLLSVYGTDLSNFQYRFIFETDGLSELVVENTDYSTDELMRLGRYLIVDGDGSVETDIAIEPSNIMDADQTFALSADDDNVIEIGIDTSYIFSDRYSEARDSYEKDIETVKRWFFALIGGIIAALLSVVFAVRGFGESDRREIALDRIPLEALVFLMALSSIVVYVLFKLTAYRIFVEVIAADELEFWRDTAKGVIVWLMCVMIMSSLYRRSLHGGIFSHSLLSGFVSAVSDEEAGRPAWNALKGYAAFLLIDSMAIIFIVLLWTKRETHAIYLIAMWIVAALLIAFDIWVYLMRVRRARETDEIRRVTGLIAGGRVGMKLSESDFEGTGLEIAQNINNISDGLKTAVDEQVKADKLKADLITNVSHDIRTPLTSIINYVDLIKREEPEDPTIVGYIDVLEQKSARLKNLTDDLIEASKASSGNIKLDMQEIDMGELAAQAGGELKDKFTARDLDLELSIPEEPARIKADGRYLYRVLENLYNNAAKYSMEGTRVYAEVREEDGAQEGNAGHYIFTIKNVSSERLNISPDELTERFVRGDTSRNTEGSGLGLSISKSLTDLMGGRLLIEIDGDLYKASVIMDKMGQGTE